MTLGEIVRGGWDTFERGVEIPPLNFFSVIVTAITLIVCRFEKDMKAMINIENLFHFIVLNCKRSPGISLPYNASKTSKNLFTIKNLGSLGVKIKEEERRKQHQVFEKF